MILYQKGWQLSVTIVPVHHCYFGWYIGQRLASAFYLVQHWMKKHGAFWGGVMVYNDLLNM